jgi:ribosomal-protein-alanine N-acetyltransferase
MDFSVSSVSSFWLSKLVRIDATWNPSAWSEKLFHQEFANRNAEILGLFVEEELIGYVIAHVILDEAHIVSLGVTPERRGLGGGSFLLAALMQKLKRLCVKVVTLEVRESNRLARKLYLSHGFEEVGVRRHYYSSNQEDAVAMRYEITSALPVDRF